MKKNLHPFQVYWRSLTSLQKKELCIKTGYSYHWLRKIGNEVKAGAETAKSLADNTPLSLEQLRPDIWEPTGTQPVE